MDMDQLKEMLSNLTRPETYVYWVEFFTILCFLLFCVYVAYSLNLFKKGS